MTTAPMENRGGDNGGPQNNAMNISPNGGAGQNGSQAATYIPDMKSLGSTGQETMAQQGGAAMYQEPRPALLGSITGISAPTEMPDQSVLDGITPFGQPNNIPGLPTQEDSSADKQRLREYLPALEHAASLPNSSEAFRNYVRIVRANL